MIDRVIGNYRIVEKVGEGGMGTVYRAVDLMLEREVAIKAIRPELSREPEIVERFRAEARMLARLNHPAIATIYSFFVEGEDLYLAMEFVRGRSLSWLLHNAGPLPWEQAVPLLALALDGIEQAHRAGIVHRDLKSDNLMITESGAVKVMDFGIARLIGSSRLTRTGLLVGTLHYMAPEQIRGEEVDRRADVYALGAVLYEMLTGRVPFAGGSDFAVLKAHVEEDPKPPSAAISHLPPWLDEAILKALAKEPADRFQTVEELRLFLLGQGSPAAAGLAAIKPITAITPASPGAPGAPVALFAPAALAAADQPTQPRSPTPGAVPAAELGPGPGSTAVSGTTLAPPPATPEQLPGQSGPPAAGTSLGPGWTADAPGGSRPTAAATAAARHRPALLAVLAVAALAAVAILFRTLGPPADRPRSRDAPRAAGAGAPAPATAGAAGAAAGGADRPAVSPDAAAGGADGGTAPASVLPADQTTAGAPQPAGAPAAADAGTQAIPPGTAPAGGATTEIAGRQEEERGARADGGEATGSGSPGGATGAGVARALPAAELRQLGGELAAESGKLRDLYADFLSKKEKAGRRLTANDDKLKDEIKELQRAAEGFGAPFQTGFWARARNRLGRFGRSEDPNAQITRLARALAGSGARADALMAQVKPDPAVRQLWRHIRRQCRRVAEICGV